MGIGAVLLPAWDGSTAVLDSCSPKRRRARRSVREEKREHRTKARTFASSLSWMVGKLVMRERRVWRILNLDSLRNAVVDCLDGGH
jgi:hypothetical protein